MTEIAFTDDLDLALIADSGQCFRWEETEPGVWRIVAFGLCVYLERHDERTLTLTCDEAEFESIWRSYLDYDEEYAAIRSRVDRTADGFLARAMDHERGIRILQQDPWETLVSFIISQNRNIPAIRRSIELLAQSCGEPCVDVRGRTYHSFPTADAVRALGEEGLKACKLGYRARYVHAAACAVAAGEIDLSALVDSADEYALEALMGLLGVGVKVASCVCLFGLHHLNAFPEDVWIKRVLAKHYETGYPFEAYAPYNGVYQQYLFAYYRNGDKRLPT